MQKAREIGLFAFSAPENEKSPETPTCGNFRGSYMGRHTGIEPVTPGITRRKSTLSVMPN
jgi:hypothetical protein